MAYRFRDGFTLPWNGKFNGHIVSHSDRFSIPLRRRKPTVFAVWNDLFHEAVPGAFVQAAYTTIAQARQHTFLVLTKRAQRMADILTGMGEVGLTLREGYSGGILPNVWHGLTVCNQDEADEKIPTFLQVPGKKFLSIEPMLGAVDLWAINDGSWWDNEGATRYNALTGTAWWGSTGEHGLGGGPTIDAVILGGETGPGARPMHPDWVRSVRDQCAAAGVPFFFKSWGAWRGAAYFDKENNMVPGSHMIGRLLDGRTHDDLPWVKP